MKHEPEISYLDLTLRAVRDAVNSGRAGTPVAARWIAHTLEDADDIPLLQARLLDGATKIFGGHPATLHAQGSVASGQISTLVRMQQGPSLLVSAGVRRTSAPLAEAIVFGNHGVIRAGGTITQPTRSDAHAAWTLTDDERRWAQWIRQSQQHRQAVDAMGTVAEDAAAGTRAKSSIDILRREKRRPLKPPFGVLLVAGEHTHQPGYAEALAADPRCRLIGVVDEAGVSPRRNELNQQLAQRLSLRVLPDLAESLHRPDVHAVSICAEPERRAKIIIAAARAGKHLYLDKPLCANAQEARDIVTAVRDAGLLGHMFSQVLFHPATQVQRIVESGHLGDITAVHCDLTFAKGHAGSAKLGKMRTESAAPTGFEFPDAKREMTNIGVYCLVMLIWSLKRQVRRVFASTGNYFFAEHQARDIEDFGQMLLELDGGITASITASRSGWLSHPSGGLNRVCLAGTKGCAVVDAYAPLAEIWCDAARWTIPERNPEDPMAMWATLPNHPNQPAPKQDWFSPFVPSWTIDASHFFDCLEEGRDPEITVEIAAAATDVLSAGYRSAAEHRVIALS